MKSGLPPVAAGALSAMRPLASPARPWARRRRAPARRIGRRGQAAPEATNVNSDKNVVKDDSGCGRRTGGPNMSDKRLLFLCLRFRPDEFAQISQFLLAPPERSALEALAEFLRVFLKLGFTPELRGIPSSEFVLAIEGVRDPRPPPVEDTIVFALEPLELRQAAELQEKIELAQKEGQLPEAHVSVDLP